MISRDRDHSEGWGSTAVWISRSAELPSSARKAWFFKVEVKGPIPATNNVGPPTEKAKAIWTHDVSCFCLLKRVISSHQKTCNTHSVNFT